VSDGGRKGGNWFHFFRETFGDSGNFNDEWDKKCKERWREKRNGRRKENLLEYKSTEGVAGWEELCLVGNNL
jgi:hypothetical protein